MTLLTAALYLATLSPVPTTLPLPEASAVMAIDFSVSVVDQVEPPHGFVAMCETDKPLCNALAASNPGPVERDPASQRTLLAKVNHIVNATVRQASDQATVGVPDMWRRTGLDAESRGDCEDLAIEKRLELIDAGFPAENLYFAVGYKTGIGLHAVLVAHTDRGEVVLDSRTAALAPLQRAPYIWVSKQVPGMPQVWTDPSTTPAMSSRALALSRSGTTAALVD